MKHFTHQAHRHFAMGMLLTLALPVLQQNCMAVACEKCGHYYREQGSQDAVLTVNLSDGTRTWSCNGEDCTVTTKDGYPDCASVYDSLACNFTGPEVTGAQTVKTWNWDSNEYVVDPEAPTTWTTNDCADSCSSGCDLPQ